MIFATKDMISGVPAKTVRDFFRKTSNYRIDSALIEEFCGLGATDAASLLSHCIAQGWLQLREEGDSYEHTGAGRQVAAARIGKAISRAKADTLVAELLERAAQWNATPGIQASIEEIRVFGSYLTDKAELGDIDIAVKIKRAARGPGETFELNIEKFAKLHGHAIPNSYLGLLMFWEELAIRTLKARQAAISFCAWDTLEQLNCPQQTIFEVACGLAPA